MNFGLKRSSGTHTGENGLLPPMNRWATFKRPSRTPNCREPPNETQALEPATHFKSSLTLTGPTFSNTAFSHPHVKEYKLVTGLPPAHTSSVLGAVYVFSKSGKSPFEGGLRGMFLSNTPAFLAADSTGLQHDA